LVGGLLKNVVRDDTSFYWFLVSVPNLNPTPIYMMSETLLLDTLFLRFSHFLQSLLSRTVAMYWSNVHGSMSPHL
jgi:hypothetical protein